MSRIGIRPVELHSSVTVELQPTEFIAKGPLGQIRVALPHGVKLAQKDQQIIVDRIGDAKQYRALHGTIRNLVSNAIEGVSKGFEKKLELVGIGYRAAIEGSNLVLQVGFTHPVSLVIPQGLQTKVEKNVITVSGSDKHQIGQFAANIRAVRKPEPYKGKGIRYQGEKVRMKQGKATKG